MKILTGQNIRQADQFTIENEPIESIALMERAAESIAAAICQRMGAESRLLFLIGKGNNGGDGMAVARILSNAGFECSVVLLHKPEALSEDCRFNYDRLPEKVEIIDSLDNTAISEECNTVIIDAILGSGTTGDIREPESDAIRLINRSSRMVISIDLPSGMKTEWGNECHSDIVNADVTLTIEFPKLAMLLPESGELCGEIEVIDIGLSRQYSGFAESHYHFTEPEEVASLIKSRNKFAHKGTYGHALLICGSRSMAGAAILAASGALRSGCGLVSCHVPEIIAPSINANAPSAVTSLDNSDYFSTLPADTEKYSVVGIGCGLGTNPATVSAVEELLKIYSKPMVLDADALNIIAYNKELSNYIPPGSVLTPHPGELQRLVGEWSGEEDKLTRLRKLATSIKSTVILKGAYTAVCLPDGNIYFNPSGNPGMAKGGSGDVLTGLVTGLMARGYRPEEAAVIGVYLHGRAGDKAAEYYGNESVNAGDLPDFIAEAYTELIHDNPIR